VTLASNTQLSVTVSDSVLSPCSVVQLSALSPGTVFGVSAIPYAAPLGGGQYLAHGGTAIVPLRSGTLDDGGWSGIPLGFHFSFLGYSYDSINVGTNGTLNFGNYSAFSATQYSFPGGFPSSASPHNTIALAACDLYLVTSGSISYRTVGTAPNRTFHILYDSVPGYTTNGLMTAEAIFYEIDGSVDMQITSATSTAAKTIGLQSNDTIGATAPGRNAYTGSISNEAWHFGSIASNNFRWIAGGNPTTATLSSDSIADPIVTGPLSPGSYTYTVTVSSTGTACTATATATFTIGSGCVWPGDADNSHLVDNNDLLAIGLAYDSTGPARSAASIVWMGQSADDWADTLPGAVNF
jgi:hypothetical protein